MSDENGHRTGENLLVDPPSRGPDLPRVERAIAELLDALGVDRRREGLRDTPRRVAATLGDLLRPRPFRETTFVNDGGYDELVVVSDIAFSSLCEHHLLPFTGVAHLAYLPRTHIVGLSKLARVVDRYSRRLQVQERMTQQIADWLTDELDPRGVGVVVEAEHLCMQVRGARSASSRTTTSALRGRLRDDPRTRSEFLSLVRR